MVNVVGEVLHAFEDIAELMRRKMDKFSESTDEHILNILEDDFVNGSLDWIYNKDKLIAVVRYEIIEDGTVANIFDLIIDDTEEDSFKIIKYFIARGWARFPSLRRIQFQRVLYDNRGYREYGIKEFF